MTVVRVVEMPTCKVTDKPIANIRATAVREVRVGLRLAFEVDSRAVGPRGRSRNPMARINHGTYSGVAMSKVRDRHIADRIAIVMIDVPVPTMAPTDSAIPATASREQTTILAIPMRRFCSTVGTGRSASNGATRVARSAGRKAANTVMTMPMRNSTIMSPHGQANPKAKAPV